MTVLVQDPDFTLHVGDSLETLRTLPEGSVDCCVTSPPYWGLRDYGTGVWEGGDPDCDHSAAAKKGRADYGFSEAAQVQTSNASAGYTRYDSSCKCGATRADRQLGLEATPDEYVANLVGVFREVRRVLADHGSLWLNLGDSYAASHHGKGGASTSEVFNDPGDAWRDNVVNERRERGVPDGLKPKDLVGVPWRVAFALQADGWYLRSDIIWSKPNPMPESVTDRPTKAHEYVFLLTKGPRYFFDQEAVREPHNHDGRTVTQVVGQNGSIQHRDGERWPNAGRNVRSVWEIATRPFAEAHFATYPPELVRRALLAGCPERVCGSCAKPSERIVERVGLPRDRGMDYRAQQPDVDPGNANHGRRNISGAKLEAFKAAHPDLTVGWSDCGHNDYRPGTVLDPFLGSGTTALVAREHGRRCVGIELNPSYADMAARRLGQLSLLADAHG